MDETYERPREMRSESDGRDGESGGNVLTPGETGSDCFHFYSRHSAVLPPPPLPPPSDLTQPPHMSPHCLCPVWTSGTISPRPETSVIRCDI